MTTSFWKEFWKEQKEMFIQNLKKKVEIYGSVFAVFLVLLALVLVSDAIWRNWLQQ